MHQIKHGSLAYVENSIEQGYKHIRVEALVKGVAMYEVSAETIPTGATRVALAVELTGKIVAAYVAKNEVSIERLCSLIASVHSALIAAGRPVEAIAEPEKLPPAVSVKKSVMPDYIVCLEDGRRLKMLKRHLRMTFGLSPDEYRAKWGLPADYPMVAPNYAAQRSVFAKSIGLGRRATQAASAVAEPVPVKKAGRPKKSAT